MSTDKCEVAKHRFYCSRQDAKNAKKTKGIGSMVADAIIGWLEQHGWFLGVLGVLARGDFFYLHRRTLLTNSKWIKSCSALSGI